MPVTHHVTPRGGDVVLLVGTMKGAFIFRADRRAATWEVGGPYFPGSAVYAMAYDARGGRQRLWAGPEQHALGRHASQSSDDFGQTWTNPEEANVKFPEGTGAALKQIWQIAPGREAEPDTLYCGVEPAALFVSRDAGGTWSLVEGLWNHPQRARWQPGGGGLCLHTILLDPERRDRMRDRDLDRRRLRTDDGGRDVAAVEQGRARRLPARQVSRVRPVRAQGRAVEAAARTGCSCRTTGASIAATIAARAGPTSPTACRPTSASRWRSIRQDPDCAWIVPLESDEFRCTPEGKLRVYRTRDARRALGAADEGAAAGRRVRDRAARRARGRHAGNARASTSARAAASCSARRTKARLVQRWPTGCRRSSRSRPPSSDGRPVVIPGALRELAGNREEVRVETPRGRSPTALARLWTECPALRDRVDHRARRACAARQHLRRRRRHPLRRRTRRAGARRGGDLSPARRQRRLSGTPKGAPYESCACRARL